MSNRVWVAMPSLQLGQPAGGTLPPPPPPPLTCAEGELASSEATCVGLHAALGHLPVAQQGPASF